MNNPHLFIMDSIKKQVTGWEFSSSESELSEIYSQSGELRTRIDLFSLLRSYAEDDSEYKWVSFVQEGKLVEMPDFDRFKLHIDLVSPDTVMLRLYYDWCDTTVYLNLFERTVVVDILTFVMHNLPGNVDTSDIIMAMRDKQDIRVVKLHDELFEALVARIEKDIDRKLPVIRKV